MPVIRCRHNHRVHGRIVQDLIERSGQTDSTDSFFRSVSFQKGLGLAGTGLIHIAKPYDLSPKQSHSAGIESAPSAASDQGDPDPFIGSQYGEAPSGGKGSGYGHRSG